MNKTDTNTALDFIKILLDESTTDQQIENHTFIKKLDKDPNFSTACKITKISPYFLAEMVAKGLVTYYEDTDKPFNKGAKKRIRPHIDKLLNELHHTRAFECEFEQLILVDLLTRLKSLPTPERGFQSEGDPNNYRKRKLIKELSLSAPDHAGSPTLIASLAAIVDPDVDVDLATVEKMLQRTDLTKWEAYSQEFLQKVFVPYGEFRSSH